MLSRVSTWVFCCFFLSTASFFHNIGNLAVCRDFLI